MFETVQYARGLEVIYPTEIGGFAVIPALDTAAMKDELVADFGIASPQVSAAAAFVILILSGFSAPHCGATVYHSDGSVASVQALHKAAHDGDTITLPSGTFRWNATLNITKGITLQGNTTVTGNAMDANGFTVTDNTIILDDSPNTIGRVISVTLTPSQSFRCTGLTFRVGSNNGGSGNNTFIALGTATSATNSLSRIDHCNFDGLNRRGIGVNGSNYGVADHNVASIKFGLPWIYPGQASLNGGSSGNGGWADYSWYGTDKFFFFEDNYISLVSQAGSQGVNVFSDTSAGCARYVVRYCHIKNGLTGDHGTEGGNTRNTRAVESYKNLMEFPAGWTAGGLGVRGGIKIAHDNTATGGVINLGPLNYFRSYGTGTGGSWGGADGWSPWDMSVTDVDPGGEYPTLDKTKQRHVDPHSSYVFFSGTCTAGSTTPFTSMTDGVQNWTPDMWAGYSIHNVESRRGSFIKSNTSTTITYERCGQSGPATEIVFNVGDHYQIRRVLRALDSAGAGKGDLISISGSNPINTALGIPYWPRCVHEPCITWNNKNTTTGQELEWRNFIPWITKGNTVGADYLALGGGFPANSTPQAVRDALPASVNGVQYSGTFVYPHPLVTAAPAPTPSATRGPSTTSRKKAKKAKKKKRWPKIGE